MDQSEINIRNLKKKYVKINLSGIFTCNFLLRLKTKPVFLLTVHAAIDLNS